MKKVIFVGDVLVGDTPDINLDSQKPIFLDSDAVIANFEGVFRGDCESVTKAGPVVFQHEQATDFLNRIGVTDVTICNNHTYDFGFEALEATKNVLARSDINVLSAEAGINRMFLAEKEERSVSLITCCETHPVVIAGESIDLLPLRERLFSVQLLQEVSKAAASGDWVIVSAHAGLELVNIPLTKIRQRYRELVRAGAHVVVAHHPHVPQGFEEYLGGAIFFSLGNFFFQRENSTEASVNGMAIRFKFEAESFTFDTYRVRKDSVSNNVVLLEDNFSALNDSLQCAVKYKNMLYEAKTLHSYVFEFGGPLLEFKSIKAWSSIALNLLLRPIYLIKRRRAVADLIEKNESYHALKKEIESLK